MSDWLVSVQEWIQQYPAWMVAGVIGAVIAIVLILLFKFLRIVGIALVVGIVVAVGWFVWQHMASAP